MSTRRTPRRPWGRLFVSFALWVAFLWLLFRMLGQLPSREEWLQFTGDGSARAVILFFTCFSLATFFRAIRFGYFLRTADRIPWPRIILDFPWLFLLGAITPFRLGEGYRAFWVRKLGGNPGSTLLYWAIERVYDLVILLIFLFLGIRASGGLEFLMEVAPDRRILLLLVASIAAVALVAIALRNRRYGQAAQNQRIRLKTVLAKLFLPSVHLVMLLLSLLIWTCMFAAFFLPLKVLFGETPPYYAILLTLAAVNLASLLTVAPGNIGSYQAAMVLSLASYGYDEHLAFMASVVLNAANLATVVLLGFAGRFLAMLLHKKHT